MSRAYRWIIGLRPGAAGPDEQALARAGLRIVERHAHADGACLLVQSQAPLSAEALAALQQQHGVAYVEADQVIELPPQPGGG
jgi:hypothetical protein